MKTKKMNKLNFLIGLLVVLGAMLTNSVVAQEKLELLTGETIKLDSKALGEERVMSVYLPAGYEQSSQNYPVLYLLDGRAHFRHASAAIDYLSARGIIPQMIVVAVHNVDRTRDFSPVPDKKQPNTGGANKFLSFLSDELSKHIQKNYRVSDFAILFGHSFGGTFTNYALIEKPELFDGYIAVSPYLMYADNHMVKESQNKLKAKYNKQKFWYMSVGNEENYFEPLDKFSEAVKTKSGDAIKFKYDKFESENHGTTPYLSAFYGLKFIFSDWQLSQEVFNKGLAAIDEHYKEISKKYGFEIATPENQINLLGYNYLQKNEFDNAIKVFKENVKRYPKSANVYDSLGEAFEKSNKLKEAKENYETAYKLGKENGDANTGIFKANFERVQAEL
ncbi:MAG: prolyl oligopeptidase family serine peptidase [Chloroflexia bacterium]|nr:prolyl oligopeptidase family serine peptidase [Chloroflexia bacterium]